MGRVRLSSDLEESCISREYDKSKRIAGVSLDLVIKYNTKMTLLLD